MTNLHKLKNGMRVHLVPFSGTDATTVLVQTGVGSRYEPNSLWGASHFIEHLMFKGTQRRPTTMDISKTLDRYGAQYNAYTGKDITGYYVRINGEKTDLAIDLLHDMLFQSLYDKEEMDRERHVIIEEIKMYEENPMIHIDNLAEEAIFAGNTLGKEIAGTPDSMLSMDRDEIIAFRNQYYAPENMVIVVAGAVPDNVLTTLEATFGTVPAGGREPQPFTPFETLSGPTRVRFQTKTADQVQLSFAFYGPHRHDPSRYTASILQTILGGMMSSRLFTEVRERRGLCYDIRAGMDTYADAGAFTIQSGLNAKRLDEAATTIFAELKKMKEQGITREELAYVQDHIEGGLKLRLENSSHRAEFIGRQELYYGRVLTPEEMIANYRSVTLSDVQQLAQNIFKREALSVAVIGPYASADDVLSHLQPSL